MSPRRRRNSLMKMAMKGKNCYDENLNRNVRKFALIDTMRDMVISMKSLATKRVARRSMVITNLANIMTTSPKRAHTKRDLIITTTMVIKMKVDTKIIMDTRKNMARKEDLTIIRNGGINQQRQEAMAVVAAEVDMGVVAAVVDMVEADTVEGDTVVIIKSNHHIKEAIMCLIVNYFLAWHKFVKK